MVLNDADITARLAAPPKLIDKYDPKNIRNCAYTLRAGRAFDPGSGQERVLGQITAGVKSLAWEIGPSETLVVMTTEIINIPNDLCATYSPLHRHATNGLMLLNPAVVEPGYEGPLSCFLLNFSSQKIQIAADEDISKILFHKLTAVPTRPEPLSITTGKYQDALSKAAARYHRSFLDISGIEERAAAKASAAVKQSLVAGGIIVAVLVLWASLEPLTSKWLWEKTGVTSTTQRTQNAELLKDLEAARAQLLSTSELKNLELKSERIANELAEVKKQLEAQKPPSKIQPKP